MVGVAAIQNDSGNIIHLPELPSTPVVLTGVLICVDFGLKRVGLATCDVEGRAAVGAGRIEGKAGKALASSVREAGRIRNASGFVIGEPSTTRGNESVIEGIHRLAESLMASGMPVTFWPERFSTASALSERKFYGGKGREAKSWADEAAAIIILQDYLDWRRGVIRATATSDQQGSGG